MKEAKTVKSFYGLGIALFTAVFLLLFESHFQAEMPKADTPPELYANQTGDNLRRTFCQAIQSANTSILLLIYTLTDKEIISCLQKKSKEGVQITVITDGKSSPSVERKLGNGIKTVKRTGKGIMHLKILVIDSKLVTIGSANFTGESLHLHGNLVAGMEHPGLAKFIEEKAEAMMEDSPQKVFLHREYLAGKQRIEAWFLPDDPSAIDRIKTLIRSAKKTIKVAMFTWTRHDLTQELVQAKKRGIEVQAVLDRNSGQGVSHKVACLLQRNLINIKLSTGKGLLHHKFIIIDDDILVNGSANWTKAAFTFNDDCFLIIHSLTEKQKEKLNSVWNLILSESKAFERR